MNIFVFIVINKKKYCTCVINFRLWFYLIRAFKKRKNTVIITRQCRARLKFAGFWENYMGYRERDLDPFRMKT